MQRHGDGLGRRLDLPRRRVRIGAGTCSAVLTSCADLVGTGATDGVYTLDPDGVGSGQPEFDGWCDADGGWTLIESFSYGNNANTQAYGFSRNRPLNEASPSNHALHRLSLTKIQALEAVSSESMATGNMDTSETLDFIRTPLANMKLTTASGTPFCATSTAGNIRGHGCVGCSVPWWQNATQYHLVTDSMVSSCGGARPWNTGASTSEDNFGYYGNVGPTFSCVSTVSSTTSWWLR